MAFHSPQICLVLDFGLTTSLPFSPSPLFPVQIAKSYLSCEGFGSGLCAGVCVCVTDSLSFAASPEGHWPVKMSLVTPGTTKP